MEKPLKRKNRTLRIVMRILLGILIFFVLLILFIRSPWGQNIIVQQVVAYVSGKTHTKVEIGKLYLTFSGNIYLENLYLEDTLGDTLVYSNSLEADLPLWPIIRGKGIAIDRVDWNGLQANINRKDSLSGFNFQFLIDAFASEETPQETPQEPVQLKIGKINFTDFRISFQDEVAGIDTKLRLGELAIKVREIDLEAMRFDIAQIHLNHTTINYLQTFANLDTKQTEEETVSPYVVVDELKLNAVKIDYNSVPDGLKATADIKTFLLELRKADIASKDIVVNRLILEHSDFLIETTVVEPIKEAAEEVVEIVETPKEFTFPDWAVVVNEIALKNNNIGYFVDGAQTVTGRFNPDALDIQSFELLANEVALKDNAIQVNLESLRLIESSGIAVKSVGFALDFNQRELSVTDLGIHVNDNLLRGNILLNYPSVNDLLNKPESISLNTTLSDFQIAVQDAFVFAPELQQNRYLLLLGKNNLNGKLEARGSLADLQIAKANLRWGETSITARGAIKEVLDTQRMAFDFPELFFQTSRKDVLLFVNEKEMGVSIPEEVMLSANFKGKLNDLSAQALLETTQGSIALEGDFAATQNIAFRADVNIKDLEVGKILRNDQLGVLDFSLKASGSGKDLNSLNADLDARIERFSFNNYPIEDWRILGELQNGEGNVTSTYKDENIDIDLNTFIALDSLASHIIADLDLRGINLQSVGMAESDIRSAFKLHADFKGNPDDFTLSAQITDGLARKDNQTYLLGNFNVEALVKKDSTSIDLTNKMIQGRIRANAHPKEFSSALQHHFEHYLSDSLLVHTDSLTHPLRLQLRLKIAESPLLNDVFLTGLERMDTININLDFDQRLEKLTANIQLPYLSYNGNVLDSLSFVLDSDNNQLDFDLGFQSLDAGPLAIKETHLQGNLKTNLLWLDFASYHNQERIINVRSRLAIIGDTLRFGLEPEELILNRALWEVPEQNSIVYADKHLSFSDFRLSNQNRVLEISDKNPQIEQEHIEVSFQDFRLSDLLNYFNPEKALAQGKLDGELIIIDPFGSLGLLASLDISDLEALEIPLGNLSLDAKAVDTKNYDFNLGLNGGDIDLSLEGDYSADEATPSFHLDLALNQLKLQAIEKLSSGEIKNAEGNISGNFNVSGTTTEPQYKGKLDFNEVAFYVKKLNAQFKISEQSIALDNSGLYLDKFSIGDEKDNTFIVDGAILTTNFTNPDFDLKINADNFSVLNSTREDNDLFYGTASFDVDATLAGNLNLPQLKMRLDLHPSTEVTYIMAESEVQVEERDGVVLFVNRANPDDIITQTTEESYTVSGIDVEALISIQRDATFNIIINEQTGDNLKISGEGDLNLDVDPNGRINLTGRYEMTSGHFEMNLYNLVKRRFEVVEGSSVTWSGDPMDASLDIRAIYEVETSASALMAAQTSGMDTSEAGKFRQRLPFLVYLNIDGEIMQPDLSFNIDMPEDERGALGGQVYSRIRQIDQQEDERNRQVFSLLVLNRFFPDSGSDGSGGGAIAMARNNLNQALSDQLNNLSDQLLGKTGVELDFGLNSYTDYQGSAPQDRTQLDITAQKKLFDDRLILSVGSEVDIEGSNQAGESTPVIGNVAIEYLITEDGRFRLKGFRKNQYENVIDGQIFVNGIALIFSKEFNKYKELWKKEVVEEKEKKTDNDESE